MTDTEFLNHSGLRRDAARIRDLEEKGNPVKLWDLRYVRTLEAQGR